MQPGTFRPAKPSAIRENILNALRQALIKGRLEPDQEVSDSALAGEFQVSRGPVREALLILAEEGLLEHVHNRGFRIPKLTVEDLRQIAVVRAPLEMNALIAARERATAGDIECLHTKKLAIDAGFASGGLANCFEAEFEFHEAVWTMSGNRWLAAALRRVCMPYFTYVSPRRLGRHDMTAELLSEQHEQYLRYIAGDDSRTAEECVRFHLGLGE